jgi:hypothetical protein
MGVAIQVGDTRQSLSPRNIIGVLIRRGGAVSAYFAGNIRSVEKFMSLPGQAAEWEINGSMVRNL